MLVQTSYSKTYSNLVAVFWSKLYIRKHIRISMLFFQFLIQIIYRGCRMGGAGVGAAPSMEDAVLTPPYDSAVALPATI
jgi:hypothetical protein